jgi:hypothetical protein
MACVSAPIVTLYPEAENGFLTSNKTDFLKKVISVWFFCHPQVLICAGSSAFCDTTSRLNGALLNNNGQRFACKAEGESA